jgi:hypothetical protein
LISKRNFISTLKMNQQQQQQQQQFQGNGSYIPREGLPSGGGGQRINQPIEARGTLRAQVIEAGIGPKKANYLKLSNSAIGEPKHAMLSIPMSGLEQVVKLVNRNVSKAAYYQREIKKALDNDTLVVLANKENFFRYNPYNDSSDIHVRQEAVAGEPGVANIYVTLVFIMFNRAKNHFLEEPMPVISISKYPNSWQWERSVDIQGLNDFRMLQEILALFYDDQSEYEEEEDEEVGRSDEEEDIPVQVGGGDSGAGPSKINQQPGRSADYDDVVMVEDPDAPQAKKGKRIVYKRAQPYNKHQKKQHKLKKL